VILDVGIDGRGPDLDGVILFRVPRWNVADHDLVGRTVAVVTAASVVAAIVVSVVTAVAIAVVTAVALLTCSAVAVAVSVAATVGEGLPGVCRKPDSEESGCDDHAEASEHRSLVEVAYLLARRTC
jgi:hypothetical protein